jgi:type I restriction enzyme S subunit
VGINHLGADRMYGWAVALAPNAEQRLLVEALMQSVVRLQNTKRELEAVSKLVGATDRSILAKAFRGELVTQDPADEPAAVMLERIKKEASEDNGAPVKKGRGRAAGERRRTRRT